MNYYRLIQVDINGDEQSYIPASVLNEERGIKIVPNPVSDHAIISFGSAYKGASELTVTDISGKVVHRATINTIKGTNSYELDTRELSNGVYLFKIENEQEKITVKFMK